MAQPLVARQDNDLQERLQAAVDKTVGDECPGIVVVILQDGQQVCNVARGVRKVDEPENLITVDDKMHLGSCTKAMTATLLGILVQEGTLSWDDTLKERLPVLASKIAEDYHDATLWQLVTHRGAVKGDAPFWLNRGAATHENRLEIVQAGLTERPQDLEVGKFNYSNTSYIVAALFAEAATEKTWEALMAERLFKPLKMETAGFGAPDKRKPATQPWGHIGLQTKLNPVNLDNAPSLGPAGTVHCSVSDWARFVALHLDRECQNHDLLTPETLKKLHTPYDGAGPEYAAGWGLLEDGDGIGHSGSNNFWFSSVAAYPESGHAVLIATNGPLTKVMDGVLELEEEIVGWLQD